MEKEKIIDLLMILRPERSTGDTGDEGGRFQGEEEGPERGLEGPEKGRVEPGEKRGNNLGVEGGRETGREAGIRGLDKRKLPFQKEEKEGKSELLLSSECEEDLAGFDKRRGPRVEVEKNADKAGTGGLTTLEVWEKGLTFVRMVLDPSPFCREWEKKSRGLKEQGGKSKRGMGGNKQGRERQEGGLGKEGEVNLKAGQKRKGGEGDREEGWKRVARSSGDEKGENTKIAQTVESATQVRRAQ